MWVNILGAVVFLAFIVGVGYFFYCKKAEFKEKVDAIVEKVKEIKK